ncbi:MAG: amidohydrolase family protein, partial [Clostridiales bacterium]|nr:amidohydrolase family protein [Clostridiales bacterium]
MNSLLIKNANIITMCNGIELYSSFLGITSGIIDYVSDKPPKSQYDMTFDAQNAIVIPGFVNAHTHIPMVMFRGVADDIPLEKWLYDHIFPLEEKLTPDDVYSAAKLALSEMIAGGTTCFCDMYFFSEQIIKATM